MVQSLAGRLAEVYMRSFYAHFVTNLWQAFAEALHETVRKDYWGYSKEGNLPMDDLLKMKYQVCSI